MCQLTRCNNETYLMLISRKYEELCLDRQQRCTNCWVVPQGWKSCTLQQVDNQRQKDVANECRIHRHTNFHLRLSNYQRNFCDLFPFYSTWQRSLRTLVYYRRVKYITAHHKSISFGRRRLFVDVEDPIFFTGHHNDRHGTTSPLFCGLPDYFVLQKSICHCQNF